MNLTTALKEWQDLRACAGEYDPHSTNREKFLRAASIVRSHALDFGKQELAKALQDLRDACNEFEYESHISTVEIALRSYRTAEAALKAFG